MNYIQDKFNMKIGIVLARPPAYTETFFRTKITGLQKKGFKVRLYCLENDSQFDLCPVYIRPYLSRNPVFQFFLMSYTYLSTISSLRKIIKFVKLERNERATWSKIFKKIYLNAHILKAEIDWLHFGFATMALERELLAEAIGAKMAVSFRGFDIDVYPLKNPGCYRLLWQKVDKVHSISQYLLEKARKLGLPKNKPFEVIAPTVDLNKIDLDLRKAEKRAVLKIITVARLHWIKGLDHLISTAEILKNRNIDFEWVIAGSGEKKEEERYRYHIYEKKLDKHVILLGALSHEETIRKMKDSDIYVQTSLSEGFCNAVLEAQALGKLCIAYNVGGLPENILNEKTGWLVDSLSAEKMANQIEKVLKMPDKELLEYSRSAVKRVQNNFAIEDQRKAFKNFYI